MQMVRRHEVDASMTPQNAQATLSLRAAGVFPAEGRGMASAADALSTNHAIASGSIRTGMAATMARRRSEQIWPRVRRIFNVHAHADRRAPPGRDPGCGRQR